MLLTLTLTLVKVGRMTVVAIDSCPAPEASQSARPAKFGRTLKQAAFRSWLRHRRRAIKKLELREMLALYDGDISVSAAYRAAVAEGLLGQRQNHTRYARFWDTINWRLPDSVLSAAWGVMRGNIRHRRVRLGVG